MTDPAIVNSINDIRSILKNQQDLAYRDFMAPLIPNIPPELCRMTIQKAVESRRIPEERKAYLKELRKRLN